MKYKNYIFDLYGTLVDIRTDEQQTALWEKLSLFYGYQGAFYAPGELKEAFFGTVGKMEAAAGGDFPEIKIEYAFRELFTAKGVERGIDFCTLTGQLFRAFSTCYIRLYPGAEKLLSELKNNGVRLFLLSNAQRIFTASELEALGISGYFDGVLLSSDCGVKKPGIGFFRELINRYSLDPRECLMIGNDGTADAAGAKAAGMDALYIRSGISPREDTAPAADYKWQGYDLCGLLGIIS